MLVCSVQIISRLACQSKFQMFTLFYGRHVGVPWRYTNMAASYWSGNQFRFWDHLRFEDYLQAGIICGPKQIYIFRLNHVYPC